MQPPVDTPPPPPPPEVVKKTTLSADTPMTTVAGNTFTGPQGWSTWVVGPATFLEPPEADSRVAIVDIPAAQAKTADDALAAAWAAVKPAKTYPMIASQKSPDHEGWTDITTYSYDVPPNDKRGVFVQIVKANDTWTALILDFAEATGEKRGAQLGVMFGRFLPKGGARESFAGKTAHPLDKDRVAQLTKFVEDAEAALGVPGVGLGIVENGKVILATGIGVRELGKPAKVDGDTKFLIASNSKALTTLMLAKLVDEKKLTWDTHATELLPDFKLGNADTTSKVLVRHLICACTGMPRQDMEWLLEYKNVTPANVLTRLGQMQPTSGFGELFQYSNIMAAAAGFLGGHVAYPKLEYGAAYDEAMRTRVFEPLGMTSTTLDFKKALSGDYASPHSFDLDGKTKVSPTDLDYSIVPVRPAGGVWSSVKDMLKYVQMEIDEGKLPNGKQFVSKEALFARRAPQVPISTDATYGMGLMVAKGHDITVVHHGGDMMGYHSDMMWLPESKVGLVVLTNSDNGTVIRDLIGRKLVEVLFDAKPEADAELASQKEAFEQGVKIFKSQVSVPADAEAVKKLSARYSNLALGELAVVKKGTAVTFDFGEWKSEVGTKKNADGTTSFITVSPGTAGFELVMGSSNTLLLRDAQHEYVFEEKK